MILSYIFAAFIAVFGFILSPLPDVTSFPLNADTAIGTAIGYVAGAAVVFPPLGIVYLAFMAMLTIKFTIWLFRVIRLSIGAVLLRHI